MKREILQSLGTSKEWTPEDSEAAKQNAVTVHYDCLILCLSATAALPLLLFINSPADLIIDFSCLLNAVWLSLNTSTNYNTGFQSRTVIQVALWFRWNSFSSFYKRMARLYEATYDLSYSLLEENFAQKPA